MSIRIVCKSYMNRKLRVLNCHESRIAHSLAALRPNSQDQM